MIHNYRKKITVLILCGGVGSRLGELGKKTPKTLLKINKKPILQYIINNILDNGIEEIFISGFYKISQIKKYIKKYKSKNIKCFNDGNISILERIKKNLKRTNNNLLVCYGDEISNVNIQLIIKKHNISKKLLTITTAKLKSNFGFLKKTDMGFEFDEKPYLGNYNIGFMIFDQQNLKLIGSSKSLPNFINKLCKKNLINEYIHNDKHITVNTIEDLYKAKKEIKNL